MVKLHTSLLAVTLATVPALACGNEFQRRGESDANNQGVVSNRNFRYGFAVARHNNLQSRGLVDEEDLFVRGDAFDDLDAREPGGGASSAMTALSDAFKVARRLSKHKHTKHFVKAVDVGSQAYGAVETLNSRGLEDNEDLFVRDFDAFDDLDAREPGGKGGAVSAVSEAFRFGSRLANHRNTQRAMTAVDVGSQVYGAVQMVKSRGLEDGEDIFVRDLDIEELFGREYDFLNERDTFDDLD